MTHAVTHAVTRIHHRTEVATDAPTQLIWLAAGAILSFLVPYTFTSVMSVHHDAYYLIYFASVVAFLGLYTTATGVSLVDAFRRNWRWSVIVGIPATLFVVWAVFREDDATAHPDGLYFAFEIAWRGVAYGVIDALLLSAFPALVAWALLRGDVGTLARKGAFAVLALAFAIILTATYHFGYDHYRDEGVAKPETGNIVISLPAILTTNPLGSVAAHTAMHVTAVTHAYETETFLPPQTDAD